MESMSEKYLVFTPLIFPSCTCMLFCCRLSCLSLKNLQTSPRLWEETLRRYAQLNTLYGFFWCFLFLCIVTRVNLVLWLLLREFALNCTISSETSLLQKQVLSRTCSFRLLNYLCCNCLSIILITNQPC